MCFQSSEPNVAVEVEGIWAGVCVGESEVGDSVAVAGVAGIAGEGVVSGNGLDLGTGRSVMVGVAGRPGTQAANDSISKQQMAILAGDMVVHDSTIKRGV
jgi:hypothetical protein